jgi:hypothetical protein
MVKKRTQGGRRAAGAVMLVWASKRDVTFGTNLASLIRDGFGARAEGEDAFDAITGLCGMIDRIQAEAVAGAQPRVAAAGMSYVVLQVILKEKLWGTGSGNLTELERAINAQASLGYRLHTITTASSGSKGLGGGDRIQATMVFERLT